MLAETQSAALSGIEALPVQVEVNTDLEGEPKLLTVYVLLNFRNDMKKRRQNLSSLPRAKNKIGRIIVPINVKKYDPFEKSDCIAVLIRESTPDQEDNLGVRRKSILGACPELKSKDIPIFEIIESARMDRPRRKFFNLIEWAKEHKALIIAQSLDRLLRSEDGPQSYPKIDEVRAFEERTVGLQFRTIADPMKPYPEIISDVTNDGIKGSSKKVGRPRKMGAPKKTRAKKHFPRVLRLLHEGKSITEISKEVDLSDTMIRHYKREAIRTGKLISKDISSSDL